MAEKPITKIVSVERMFWSRMSGERGLACYDDSLYGLPLENIVGPLNDGASVEVTLRVIKRGRQTKNPWLRKRKRASRRNYD